MLDKPIYVEIPDNEVLKTELKPGAEIIIQIADFKERIDEPLEAVIEEELKEPDLTGFNIWEMIQDKLTGLGIVLEEKI